MAVTMVSNTLVIRAMAWMLVGILLLWAEQQLRAQSCLPQGWWQQEDARLRTAVEPLPYGLETIVQLQPLRFEEKLANGAVVPGIGLMAQDVYSVVPEAVSPPTPSRPYWTLEYARLIPVLIAAIQQQQRQIAELQRALAQQSLLESPRAGGAIPLRIEGELLGDNIPNPHAGTTTIPYFLPADITHAELQLYDSGGRLVRTIPLPVQRGIGSITLDMTTLATGVYDYRLVLDGRVVATKRMHLVR
ncbi:MAG: hypothetical protein NZ481_07370 [Candidatus Kapabacteria bacterium]|nr:hypothetical protein [Candidatus Kapabacteria bacterium]